MTIKKVFGGDIRYATAHKFADAETRTYEIGSDNLAQSVYDDIKNSLRGAAVCSFVIHDETEQWILNMRDIVQRQGSFVFSLGNEIVTGQIGDTDIRWYDRNTRIIDELTLRTYLAWVHSEPIQLRIEYNPLHTMAETDLFLCEQEVRQNYLNHIIHNNYLDSIHYLAQIAVRYKQEFTLFLDSFDNGMPTSFSFKVEDGHCRIYQTVYDANHAPVSVTERSVQDAADFCRQRYERYTFIEYDKEAQRLHQRYPETTPIRTKIIEDTARSVSEKRTIDFKALDAKLTAIEPQLDKLVMSAQLYSKDNDYSLSNVEHDNHER